MKIVPTSIPDVPIVEPTVYEDDRGFFLEYKTTDYYAPQHERCIRWDDPDIDISWPGNGGPIVSPKDENGPSLKDAEVFA